MNKLKNIGISALAGTLVSLSAAQAGGVSVSGSYEMSYTNLQHADGTATRGKVSGNKLGVNKNLSFGASGDVSDGGAVTWSTNIGWSDGADLSSASLAINMAGIATLTYDSGGGGTGANAVDNIIPTAWEEIDYGFSTGISDVGAVSATKGVINLTVKAPVAGTGLSISYASRMGTPHISDGATAEGTGNHGVDLVVDFVDYSAAHAGLRFGVAGQMEFPETNCRNLQQDQATHGNLHSCGGGTKAKPWAGTLYFKPQLGPLHFGVQGTFKDPSSDAETGIQNMRSIVAGAALVFGDTLSISYGVAKDKYRYNDRNRGYVVSPNAGCKGGNESYVCGREDNEYTTQKYRGFSAALNMGPVALKGTHNKVKGDNMTSIYAHDTQHTELNLSIAF